MSELSFTGPLRRAWTRTQLILFSPFDAGKWLVMGFTAWLASLAEGGTSGNIGFEYGPDLLDKDWSDLARSTAERSRELLETGLEIFVIFFLFVVIVLVCLLVLWLSARGSFMFLDNVVHNRAQVSAPWRRYARQGDSLFLWYILFSLAILVTVGSLILASILMVVPLLDDNVGRGVGVAGMIFIGSLLVLLGVAVAFVSMLVDHFVVPLMFKHDLTVTAAWRLFLPLLQQHPGSFVLYGLFFLALYIAVIVGVVAIGVMTCCAGLLIVAIPYLGTVLLLPLYVTARGLGPEFLAQFGSEFSLCEDFPENRPPPAATEPPATGV